MGSELSVQVVSVSDQTNCGYFVTFNILSGYVSNFTYYWYFGDNTTQVTSVGKEYVGHLYAKSGTYNVSVRDDHGNSTNLTVQVP